MIKKVLTIGLLMLIGQMSVVCGATVAYWQFDEDEGNTVFVDAVGTYDLTITDANHSPTCGSAIDPITNPDPGPFSTGTPQDNPHAMNTVRAHRNGVTDSAFLMRNSSWTFEGYIKRDILDESDWIACTKNIESGWKGWELSSPSTGILSVRLGRTGASDTWITTQAAGFTLMAGQWYHFALIWDHDAGATGTVSIFVDGVLQGSGAGLGDLGNNPGEYLQIGGRDTAGDGLYALTLNYFDGSLDELRWTDQVLAPSEFLNVPEPATIGLLSLGAVSFLRRKKS